METIIGGTEHPVELTEADKQAIVRRKLVQAVFATNPGKDALMSAMIEHSITVDELQKAMDYQVDAIKHLRMLGVPDGFQGLKVWSDAVINTVLDWQLAQPNPFGSGTIADIFKAQHVDPYTNAPERAKVQALLDTEARRQAADPLHVLPWMVQ